MYDSSGLQSILFKGMASLSTVRDSTKETRGVSVEHDQIRILRIGMLHSQKPKSPKDHE